MATQAVLSLTNAPDIHLLYMAGLVFLAGIAAVGSMVLLLLLTPLAMLALGRTRPYRGVSTAVERENQTPEDGAASLPPPQTRRDEAA